MNKEIKVKMEKLATQYAHSGLGVHSETQKIRRYNAYAAGFESASEIYEAKLKKAITIMEHALALECFNPGGSTERMVKDFIEEQK